MKSASAPTEQTDTSPSLPRRGRSRHHDSPEGQRIIAHRDTIRGSHNRNNKKDLHDLRQILKKSYE